MRDDAHSPATYINTCVTLRCLLLNYYYTKCFGSMLNFPVAVCLRSLEWAALENDVWSARRVCVVSLPPSLPPVVVVSFLSFAFLPLCFFVVGPIPEEVGELVVRGSLYWTLQLQNNYLTGMCG